MYGESLWTELRDDLRVMLDPQNTHMQIYRVSSDDLLTALKESSTVDSKVALQARQAPRWFRRSAIGVQMQTYGL